YGRVWALIRDDTLLAESNFGGKSISDVKDFRHPSDPPCGQRAVSASPQGVDKVSVHLQSRGTAPFWMELAGEQVVATDARAELGGAVTRHKKGQIAGRCDHDEGVQEVYETTVQY